MTTARDIITRVCRSVMAIGSGILRVVKETSARIRRKLLSLWRHTRVDRLPRDTFRRKLLRSSMALWLIVAFGAGPAAASVDAAFAGWLKSCPGDRSVATAVAPSIVLVPVLDDAGYAPLHCIWRIDVATSTTGDGDWDETHIEWQVQVNGAVPTQRISALDPHTGGTVYLDYHQYGWNCNYLCLEAGEVIARCRVTNRAGVRSPWVYTTGITCQDEASRPGAVYFDPNAAGNGNGLSWENAKTTYATAMSLLSSSADGTVCYCRAGNIANSTNVTGANKFITADPDAVGDVTLTFTGSVTGSISTTGTRGIVIGRGLKYDSASGIGKIHGHGTSITSYGACLYDLRFGYLEDISNASGSGVTSSAVRGMSHINITQQGTPFTGELFFANDCSDFLAWGVDALVGGSHEHTYRMAGGGIVGRIARYHTYLFSKLGSQIKTGIREYSDGYVIISGCKLDRVTSIGGVSPDSLTTTGGSVFVVERCHVERIVGQSGELYLELRSAWEKCTVRNCFLDNMSIFGLPRTNEAEGDFYFRDIRIVHNTLYRADAAIRFDAFVNAPVNITVRNNLFVHTGSMTSGETYIQMQNATTVTGCSFTGNTFYRANSTDKIFKNMTGSATYDLAAYMSTFSYATNESRVSSITLDTDTTEPDAGLTNGRSGAPRAFMSFNGEQYDYEAANYPSGAWLSEGAAGSYPDDPVYRRYFIPTRRGGIRIKAVI